jgi:integrase
VSLSAHCLQKHGSTAFVCPAFPPRRACENVPQTHSFRKTVATLIDDEGLSARIGVEHLGHSHVLMTQDRCIPVAESTRKWPICSTEPTL